MTAVAERRRQRKAAAQNRRAAAARSPEQRVLRAVRSFALSHERSMVKHSALHRLHARGVITWPQHQAGCAWRDTELASRDTVAARYEPGSAGGGGASGFPVQRLERQAAASRRLRDGWAALYLVGLEVASDTAAVCLGDRDPRELAGSRLPRHLQVTSANPDEVAAERGRIERAIVANLRSGLDALAEALGVDTRTKGR